MSSFNRTIEPNKNKAWKNEKGQQFMKTGHKLFCASLLHYISQSVKFQADISNTFFFGYVGCMKTLSTIYSNKTITRVISFKSHYFLCVRTLYTSYNVIKNCCFFLKKHLMYLQGRNILNENTNWIILVNLL